MTYRLRYAFVHIVRFDGNRLKELRGQRKFDQHRLAEAARAHGVGMTQSQVSRYENGQEPSGRSAIALAKALGVKPEALYGDDADEEDSLAPLAADLLDVVTRIVDARMAKV